MIHPLYLLWVGGIIVMFLGLLVLVETQRIYYRRQNEKMFGTEDFDLKIREFQFTPKEVRTLEKLVRTSHFENKDAVLNSADLFEHAVGDFYDFRNVFDVRDETLAAVASLREKMGYTGQNPMVAITSSRQFSVGNRVDLVLENGRTVKRSSIQWRTEKEWALAYDGSCGPGSQLVGQNLCIRWTRPGDAVYTIRMPVRSFKDGNLIFLHTMKLDKQQLRRWVREEVRFPVEATLRDGSICHGVLYDLSAGGILVGIPVEIPNGEHIRIRFELPSFGVEDVEIEILRNLGQKNPEYPEYYSLTASFAGAFGWTQERVLQYIFEVHKARKASEMARENA
ncbi:MAG: PilZ domain-containing protein [Fibrobacter sp.]|nr:PilZ domain-containing protein [Fibrobacter sp.]